MTVCPNVGNELSRSCNCGMHVPSLHFTHRSAHASGNAHVDVGVDSSLG